MCFDRKYLLAVGISAHKDQSEYFGYVSIDIVAISSKSC